MAEQQKKPAAEPVRAAAQVPLSEPENLGGPLQPAAESGDGAVQDLLAQREIHLRNSDSTAAAAVDTVLADQYGVTVG